VRRSRLSVEPLVAHSGKGAEMGGGGLGLLPWEKWLPPYVYGPLLCIGSILILVFVPTVWWERILSVRSLGNICVVEKQAKHILECRSKRLTNKGRSCVKMVSRHVRNCIPRKSLK
jgi:hypothetical protein